MLLLTGCPIADNYYISAEREGMVGGQGLSSHEDAGGIVDDDGSAGGSSGGDSFETPDGAVAAGDSAVGDGSRYDSSDPWGQGGGAGAGGSGGTGNTPSDSGAAANDGGTTNLVANSSFETGTSGWHVLGGNGDARLIASTTDAHGGERSLFLSGRTLSYQGPAYAFPVLLTPGAMYRVRVWGRLASGATPAGLTVTLRGACNSTYNTDYVYTRLVSDVPVNSAVWKELTGTAAAPSCAVGAMSAMDLYVEAPASVPAFYIDDVVFEPA